MDLRLLRAFVTVARLRNFGAAAEELSTSQPALTKQIQVLERRVGSVLFSRGRHGARLTPAGELLLPDALELLDRSEAFDRRAAQVASGAEGSLAIGFGLSGIELAPRAVALFRSRWPGVTISLEDMSSVVQCERLLAGSLQIGFVRLPVPAGLEHLRLRRDRLTLAVPAEADVPRDLVSWLDAPPAGPPHPGPRARPDRPDQQPVRRTRLPPANTSGSRRPADRPGPDRGRRRAIRRTAVRRTHRAARGPPDPAARPSRHLVDRRRLGHQNPADRTLPQSRRRGGPRDLSTSAPCRGRGGSS